MSLYRKYRPQTLADVVGQEHVVSTLEHAITQGQVAHAYLFAGSRGTGKTSVARILAKHLLTQRMEDEVLKRQTENGVVEGTIVDLVEIDAASNTGVDNIRDLIEKVQFSPVAASAKVYIIDEVHMLSKGAFNALLKTLEEPPPYAYFILATTELQKIPSTIQSRCQRFSFHQIREEDIIRRLQYIADREGITADRAALRAIARHAQGGMRDAISLLDQLRSLANVTAEEVQRRLGESGQEHVLPLLQALENGDREEVLRIVQHLEEAGIALETFVRQLLAEVRTRLHATVEARGSAEGHVRMLDVLLTVIRDIRIAPVPGLVLESALLRLCGEADETPPPKKEFRLLKKAKEEPAENKPAPAPQKESRAEAAEEAKNQALRTGAGQTKEKAPGKETLIEAPEVTLDAMAAVWPEIAAKAVPAALRMSLKNGRVTAVAGKTVTLSFASNFHRERVAQKEGIHMLEQLLHDHFKRPLRLECVLDEEKDVRPMADESLVDLAEAVNEIF
ncbi:MAG: DNA polymerase III subunit gamma/tau [Candidatus Peribacteraceae bacterium]|jgi:DNA polymerase-3 subunit gamma/tau